LPLLFQTTRLTCPSEAGIGSSANGSRPVLHSIVVPTFNTCSSATAMHLGLYDDPAAPGFNGSNNKQRSFDAATRIFSSFLAVVQTTTRATLQLYTCNFAQHDELAFQVCIDGTHNISEYFDMIPGARPRTTADHLDLWSAVCLCLAVFYLLIAALQHSSCIVRSIELYWQAGSARGWLVEG